MSKQNSEQAIASQTLSSIERAGFDKAACRVSNDELHELQAETGEINLFRTNFETDIALTGIDGGKRASLSVNKTDESELGQAISELKIMAQGANSDPAHDISPSQPHEAFEAGVTAPDLDAMYDRVVDFQKYVKDKYKTLALRTVSVSFARRRSCYKNSNDVEFRSSRGQYHISVQFSSKEGTDTSSMMYTGYSSFDLETPIQEATNVDMLLRQSTEQVRTEHIPKKFVGELVIAPNCLSSFLGFMLGHISDQSMISGTSIYDGKLGEKIASSALTLQSMPLSPELSSGYWVTGDGFKAANSKIVEAGVLSSYLLGLYGSNKTGKPKSVNSGGCYVIEPGATRYEDLLGSVKEGILITRFSGGRPNDRGDFSGIAKNSYHVRDGKIASPIKETTVSGNLVDLLHSIRDVSSERLNFGSSILPWVVTEGITAS